MAGEIVVDPHESNAKSLGDEPTNHSPVNKCYRTLVNAWAEFTDAHRDSGGSVGERYWKHVFVDAREGRKLSFGNELTPHQLSIAIAVVDVGVERFKIPAKRATPWCQVCLPAAHARTCRLDNNSTYSQSAASGTDPVCAT